MTCRSLEQTAARTSLVIVPPPPAHEDLPNKTGFRTFRCPEGPILLAIGKEVMRRVHCRSHSECCKSFLHHRAISQQDHAITGDWASLSAEERTTLDSDLRKLVASGNGKKGSWLKARIYETIKELNGADAKSPTVDQVLTRLPEVTRKALREKK